MSTLVAPLDVRLMNLTASLLLVGCGTLLVVAGAQWVMRQPVFAISRIVVQGDLMHNNAVTLRANVSPQISGNFFTVNLGAVRQAFEQVPWVRKAQVWREFPQTLRVQLQEQHPVARWGEDSDTTLVNREGEVFEANSEDADLDDLPRLSGPEGVAVQVLDMARQLKPVLEPMGLELEELNLSERGGWRVTLVSGAEIELGGGTPPEVVARTSRFAQTLPVIAKQLGRRPDTIESADLRHTGGYALRLRGVTTVSEAPHPRTVR